MAKLSSNSTMQRSLDHSIFALFGCIWLCHIPGQRFFLKRHQEEEKCLPSIILWLSSSSSRFVAQILDDLRLIAFEAAKTNKGKRRKNFGQRVYVDVQFRSRIKPCKYYDSPLQSAAFRPETNISLNNKIELHLVEGKQFPKQNAFNS